MVVLLLLVADVAIGAILSHGDVDLRKLALTRSILAAGGTHRWGRQGIAHVHASESVAMYLCSVHIHIFLRRARRTHARACPCTRKTDYTTDLTQGSTSRSLRASTHVRIPTYSDARAASARIHIHMQEPSHLLELSTCAGTLLTNPNGDKVACKQVRTAHPSSRPPGDFSVDPTSRLSYLTTIPSPARCIRAIAEIVTSSIAGAPRIERIALLARRARSERQQVSSSVGRDGYSRLYTSCSCLEFSA
eukprot:533744-Pleurochrysis_carterae.AAC.1